MNPYREAAPPPEPERGPAWGTPRWKRALVRLWQRLAPDDFSLFRREQRIVRSLKRIDSKIAKMRADDVRLQAKLDEFQKLAERATGLRSVAGEKP